MAYLDDRGLEHYHKSLQPSLVRSVTQAEYDALSEEEKRGLVVITDAQPSGGGGESGGTCEDVYSTEEQRIGTWIDGKPLYRKVIQTATPSTLNTIVKLENLGNVSVKNYQSFVTYNKLYLSLPHKDNTGSGTVYCIIDDTWISCLSGHANYSNKPLLVIVEYTKTTD